MVLPASLNTVTLFGTFVDSSGQPFAQETLTLTPTVALNVPADDTIVLPATRSVTLDNNGAFSVVVPACDDPDATPSGWTYTVVEQFGPRRTYSIYLPLSPGTYDLSELAPTSASNGTWVPGPSAVGVTAGWVLTANGDGTYSWAAATGGGGGGTPDAHAATHATGGTDPVTITQAQVTGLEATLATKAVPADISAAISALVSGAPTTLDTLGEIADALGDDPNLAATLTALIGAAQSDIDGHLADTTDAHDASAISVVAAAFTGLLSTSDTDVQTALATLDAAVLAAAADRTVDAVRDFGADGTAQRRTMSVTAGSRVVTVSGGGLTAGAHVGDIVIVENAGGSSLPLVGTIVSNTTTTVTIDGGDPAATTTVSSGVGFLGPDSTAAIKAARDAWVATFRSDNYGLSATKVLVIGTGLFLVTEDDWLMSQPNDFGGGTAVPLRGGTIFGGFSDRDCTVVMATGRTAAEVRDDPRLGNAMAMAQRVMKFELHNMQAHSSNPNQTFCWQFASDVVDAGLFPEYGRGGQHNIVWHNVRSAGLWRAVWCLDGNDDYNMNSEQKWINCTTDYASRYSEAIVQIGGRMKTTTSGGHTINSTPSTFTFTSSTANWPTTGVGVMVTTSAESDGFRHFQWTGKSGNTLTGVTSTNGASYTVNAGTEVVCAPSQFDQALNYIFDNCHFEYRQGDTIRARKGGHIVVIGGSWIIGVGMSGSDHAEATPGHFFNMQYSEHFDDVQHLHVIGTRYEKRGANTCIYDGYWYGRKAHIKFESVSVSDVFADTGGGSDPEFCIARIRGNANGGAGLMPLITFENCQLPGYIEWKSNAAATQGGIRLVATNMRDWASTPGPASSAAALRTTSGSMRYSLIDCDNFTNANAGLGA